ncbi:hypothetical protein RB595_000204 [Gaeumannomyces hyphopodioides]
MPPKRKPPPPRGGPRKQRAVAAGKNVVEQDVVNLTPVYLGIDHGTTATRVRVLVAGVEGSVPVSIVEAYSSAVEIGRQIGPGGFDNDVEFPGSFVWELGGNTNLNMNPFQARRAPNRMPLKWILIILAGDIDAALLEQLEQLPGGQTLFNIRDEVMNDPVKFAQLEQVWIDHFMRIKTEVDEYCELMECSVTQVILSIAHWGHTDGIQRVYDGLIRRVFTDLPESAFHYTGEANSVARCIIEEDMKLRRSELSKIAGDRRAFLFFDLGGSSLGGSLILLHRVENKTGNGDGPPARRNEPPAMLEIRDSGCFGGGEVWEWAIIENASKDRNRHWTYDQLTKYLQNFREQKGRLDNPLDRGIGISDGGETHEVSAGESRKCYGQAFQKIITLIQSEIEATIRELGGPDKFILIFTGGSCLGAHMIKFLRTYAESMKVDALFHGTGDVCKGNSDRTGMIARGNCYAMLRAISLGEFLNRGATFGIQTGDGVSKRCEFIMPLAGSGAVAEADMKCHVKLAQLNDAQDATIPMWLVCDAFFGASSDHEKQMGYNNCYDVCKLRGASKPGSYVYTMLIIKHIKREGTDTTEQASIVVRCKFTPAAPSRRKNPAVDLAPEIIPIHYHVGSGCALLDEDKLAAEWGNVQR